MLNASGHGQQAGVTSYFDSYTSHSFIQLNGTFQVTFRAKGVGGNNQLYVNVQRNASGLGPYLSQTVTLSNGWQDYTLTFSASETGSAVGTVGVALEASGAAVELDDVSLQTDQFECFKSDRVSRRCGERVEGTEPGNDTHDGGGGSAGIGSDQPDPGAGRAISGGV